MKDYDTLVDASGQVVITWKMARPTERFDTKTFSIENPSVYKQYIKVGEPTRRMLIKGE